MSTTRADVGNGANDRDRAATLQLVIALARALQAMERFVRPHLATSGLAMTEFAVLEALYHKGPLRLGEVRDRILVTGKHDIRGQEAREAWVDAPKVLRRGFARRARG